MAWKIIWTESALLDLEELANFISKDSRYYAATFVHEIRDAAHSLKAFAERGRQVPEYVQSDIRELFVSSYRLMYKITQETVYILALVHGARDLKELRKKS